MNAKTIEAFGLTFHNAAAALQAMGFENADAVILRMRWIDGEPYYKQSATLRMIAGEAILVRDLELPAFTRLDSERLTDLYIVEGRTLDGRQKLYAVRFQQQEEGPAVETWMEIEPDNVRTPLATDDDGDERAVVFARTADGSLFAVVTHPDNAQVYRELGYHILRAERYA